MPTIIESFGSATINKAKIDIATVPFAINSITGVIPPPTTASTSDKIVLPRSALLRFRNHE